MQEIIDQRSMLPWHEQEWTRLMNGRRSGKLHHALLIRGAKGLGKARFARLLAASLLCRSAGEGGIPCGQCKECLLLKAGNHPDFVVIMPEEPGKAIKIDTIREFTRAESMTTQSGGYKVTLIEPADALNMAAANSLLKTLEEPVSQTLILLVTSLPGRLPATIRSRCRRVDIPLPDRHQARQWLASQSPEADLDLLLDLASGAPLLALDLADPETLQQRAAMLEEFFAVLTGKQDPLVVAARWDKQEPGRVLSWYSGWIIDMVRLKMAPDTQSLLNPDQRKTLQLSGNSLEFKRLYELLDGAYEATRNLGGQLNSQMMLERLLLMLAGYGNRA
ncbi:MAG: DNA polymerase III subunit delta' [Gammaproteobacteria bacterium]|nr:DNA polymerase III subunit delta' [Gammaproteobacteria bacterium]